MTKYAFILGRKNLLSVAEICHVLNKDDKILDYTPEAMVADLGRELAEPQTSLNRLGGTIKIAQIFAEMASNTTIDGFSLQIADFLDEKFKGQTGKSKYGISAYSLTRQPEIFLKKILNFVKKELKERGLNSRFVNHNFKNLENAAIKGEKLITSGAEIIIIEGRSKFYLAQTIALQDFENYSKRDFDRPARDAKLGMLPPKLAQIMINLGGLTKLQSSPAESEKPTLLDPFVGVGTILTEGLLLNYKVIGSDINSHIIDKCDRNLEWTIKEYNIADPGWRTFTKDAILIPGNPIYPRRLTWLSPNPGSGRRKPRLPTPLQIQANFQKISEINLGFFKAIYQIIPAGTRVVITFPVYRKKEGHIYIDALPGQIKQLGYDIEPLIPENVAKPFGLKTFGRQSLVYDRPDQLVGREIWMFIRK